MRRQGADGPAMLEALLATNRSRCRPPLPDADVRRIVASIQRYDPESPLLVANPTDLGNAERFVAYAGDRFRYVPAWGSWLAFDGARWRRDVDGETVRTARDLLRATAAQALALSNQEEADRLLAHALASESRARIASMLDLAQALLPVATDALDQDHDAFNCANGTLDLRTGALRPHDRDDLLAHRWVVMSLVAAGIPEARIGVLNAEVAQAAADRQRIAREFNGDPRRASRRGST